MRKDVDVGEGAGEKCSIKKKFTLYINSIIIEKTTKNTAVNGVSSKCHFHNTQEGNN